MEAGMPIQFKLASMSLCCPTQSGRSSSCFMNVCILNVGMLEDSNVCERTVAISMNKFKLHSQSHYLLFPLATSHISSECYSLLDCIDLIPSLDLLPGRQLPLELPRHAPPHEVATSLSKSRLPSELTTCSQRT